MDSNVFRSYELRGTCQIPLRDEENILKKKLEKATGREEIGAPERVKNIWNTVFHLLATYELAGIPRIYLNGNTETQFLLHLRYRVSEALHKATHR